MPAPRKVLIIVTQQLGDVLLTTSLISGARSLWPQARLDVLGFDGTLSMLRGNPDVDQTIEVMRSAGWRATLLFLFKLWRRYDLALVTQAGDRAHLYGWIAARQRSGLIPLAGASRWWKRLFTTHHLLGETQRHSVVEKMLLLAPWVDPTTLAVTIRPPAPRPLPDDISQALRRPCVVVHVPSMWRYKQWPVEHYRELVAALLSDGVQVVLTGTGGTHDQHCIAHVRDVGAAPDLLDVSARLDLGQVVSLLMKADGYVGPDTSITHLAAAVGTPVVALYGPTRPVNWGPWPNGHTATPPWKARGAEPQRVQERQSVSRSDSVAPTHTGRIILMQGPSLPNVDCVPCGRAGCDDHRESRSACLEGLAPSGVIARIRELLRAGGNAP